MGLIGREGLRLRLLLRMMFLDEFDEFLDENRLDMSYPKDGRSRRSMISPSRCLELEMDGLDTQDGASGELPLTFSDENEGLDTVSMIARADNVY